MRSRTNMLVVGLAFAIFVLSGAHPLQAQEAPTILFILDASGSMWGQIDGSAKIVTAKEVLIARINDLPEPTNVGLMVFGHRTEKDCQDIEMLIPPGPKGSAKAKEKIEPVKPKGKTPISGSIREAVDSIKDAEGDRTIILVSDGKETCEGDPSDVVTELKKQGIKFRVHVIGFAVTAEERQQLAEIAKAGGGNYYSADTSDQFKVSVKKAVAEAVAAPPTPSPGGMISEKEPNNNILEPNELPVSATLTGAIGAKDSDYFKVVSTSSIKDWFNIELTNRSITLRPGLTLFDENKAKLTYGYEDTSGADLTLKRVLAPKEVIYVQVWSRSSTTGDYRLKVVPQKAYDELEPNDSAFDAKKIPLDEGVTANIMYGDDVDYYKIRTSKGGGAKVLVTVENGSTTLRPGVTIKDRKKDEMTYHYEDTSGADLEMSFDCKQGEKYYISVWSRSDTAGKYRLTVEQQ